MSAKKSIYTLFTLCIFLGICGVLTACLDIPSEPSSSGKATSLTVYVAQNGVKDSTLFKVSTQDSASFAVLVNPDKYESELKYTWYHDNDELCFDRVYTDIFVQTEDIPNRVVVKDKEGNSLEKTFEPILNSPPHLSATFYPADSSVYNVSINQGIEFKWYAYDSDDEKISTQLTIDKQVYHVGVLTSVTQSGFEPGWHSVKVEIIDKHGAKAESALHHFLVISPEEI